MIKAIRPAQTTAHLQQFVQPLIFAPTSQFRMPTQPLNIACTQSLVGGAGAQKLRVEQSEQNSCLSLDDILADADYEEEAILEQQVMQSAQPTLARQQAQHPHMQARLQFVN